MTLVSLKRPSAYWFGRIYDAIKTIDTRDVDFIEVSPSVFHQLRYEVENLLPNLEETKYYYTLYGLPIKCCNEARHGRYMGVFLKIKNKPNSRKLIATHL